MTIEITADQLRRLFPQANPALVDALIATWEQADAAGINTPLRIAHFLARVGVETGGLRTVEESLYYASTARIRAVWPSRFRTDAAAAPYVKNPKALAIKVYGGRMGNKPGPSTDGYDYRGGGMLQTTGRAGYKAMGFEANPEMLREPNTAAETAYREWAKAGCNALADADDTHAICKAINGGLTGLDQQQEYVASAKRIFGASKPKASVITFPPGTTISPILPADPAPPGPETVAQSNLVLAVQKALIEKRRPEVGKPDGIMGSKTRTAILGFQADMHLPLTGEATQDVLAAILASDPRPERPKEAKAEDRTIPNATKVQGTMGGIFGGGALITLAGKASDNLGPISDFMDKLKAVSAPLLHILYDWWPVLVLVGAAAVVYWAWKAHRQFRADFLEGKLTR